MPNKQQIIKIIEDIIYDKNVHKEVKETGKQFLMAIMENY